MPEKPLKKSDSAKLKLARAKRAHKEEYSDGEVPVKPVKPPKKQYYVSPKAFRTALEAFYEDDNLTDELADMVQKIAYGLSYAPNFINYSYKDDMVGDALVKMFKALQAKKFDIESEYNPFSYFTTIAYHAFINRIKREKKHHQAILDYQEYTYDKMISEGHSANVYVDSTSNFED